MQSIHPSDSVREKVAHALHHLDHILPAQAPILNFVHHNTIHGFQHLPFEEALAEFEKLTGINGYLPEAQHRKFYQQGRIDDNDLFTALFANKNLKSEQLFYELPNRKIEYKELYRLALLFDFSAISASQFTWQTQELNVFKSESAKSLWQSILAKLHLSFAIMLFAQMLNQINLQHVIQFRSNSI